MTFAGRVGAKRMKERITGLQSRHTDLGFDGSPLNSDNLRRTIRGVGQYHGEASPKEAIPITLPILRQAVNCNYIRDHPTLFGGSNRLAI